MTPKPPPADGMNATLRDNIHRLHERAHAERAAASFPDRVAAAITGFTGSMTFVLLHLILYSAWIIINLGWVPAIKPFDPTFVVLAMEASVEAIFLSTFVLITQNRMAAEADRRAALDLHINLLTEHELTKLSDLVARVAEHLGMRVDDPSFQEIRQNVRPERVLDELDRKPT